MSIELVNGYVCHNCDEVALAKRGVDPAKPKEAARADERDGANRPLATGERGTLVNVTV